MAGEIDSYGVKSLARTGDISLEANPRAADLHRAERPQTISANPTASNTHVSSGAGTTRRE